MILPKEDETMKLTYADYVPSFHCLAGNCPDTCCKDWQIILNEDDLRRYRALDSDLGRQILASLVTENGETRFAFTNGHCALLRPDGLCPIQAELGEQALCQTCHAHPRFIEEYGASQELSLAVSCPAAAELLLRRETPLQFVTETTAEQVDTPNELEPGLYFALLAARKRAVAIMQEETLAVNDRLALLLIFAERVQMLLDSRREHLAEALCREFSDPGSMRRQLLRAKRLQSTDPPFYPCWAVLNQMEHLTVRFPRLLDAILSREPAPFPPEAYARQQENLMVYFLFRYFLKAVNDRKLLPRVESCVFHLLCIRYLYCTAEGKTLDDLIAVCSLYCKEVEHSEENLDLLLRLFSRGTLRLSYLLSVLDTGKESFHAL